MASVSVRVSSCASVLGNSANDYRFAEKPECPYPSETASTSQRQAQPQETTNASVRADQNVKPSDRTTVGSVHPALKTYVVKSIFL